MREHRPRLELFLESPAPLWCRERQARYVERIEALDDDDAIRDFEVLFCDGCIRTESDVAAAGPNERLLDRYRAFVEWADEVGREIIGFSQCDRKSILTGKRAAGITFPRVALAEYRDGNLRFVAPSSNEGDVTTVGDRLIAHERNEVAP